MVREVFPDFRYTIERVLGEGDEVVVQVTADGTQRWRIFGLCAISLCCVVRGTSGADSRQQRTNFTGPSDGSRRLLVRSSDRWR